MTKNLKRSLIVLLYLCVVSCTSKQEIISPKSLSTLNVKQVFNDGSYNSQKISKSVFPVTLTIQGSQIQVTTNTNNKYKGNIGALDYSNIEGFGEIYHFTWYNTTIISAFNSSSDSDDVRVTYVTRIDKSVSIMFERGHAVSFYNP